MTARWMPDGWKAQDLRVHTDTSDFFDVQFGHVLLLEGRPYLIRNSPREGRFGLEEDVKHWVKRAIDLPSGEMCIVKMVFHEKFTTSIGGISFECFRSPRKEARILELVRDHPHFMHGISASDEKGNTVRVLEYISGKRLSDHIADLRQPHEAYFYETLPAILRHFCACLKAIDYLHEHGEKHGDIRRDHILIDGRSGNYRWIDFDYNFRHRENIYGYDLFGLGNVLVYIVGKGDVLLGDLRRRKPALLAGLREADLNIVFHNRLANLQKAYPYIPDSLNRVLLHFSVGANWYYERTAQLVQDLGEAVGDIH
jgi:serine/threonine protein kinase